MGVTEEEGEWVELTHEEICQQIVVLMAALLRSDVHAAELIDLCFDDAEILAWGDPETLKSIQ